MYQSPGGIENREVELDSQECSGEIKSREVELDSQERSGEIKSREVELDSQERSGEIKSREVELDSQECSGEIKSREVELDSHCELDNPLLQLFLNCCFSDIDRVTLQLLKEQLAKYTSSFTQWLTVSWVFESWSMRMNYSCLSPSPFLPHR